MGRKNHTRLILPLLLLAMIIPSFAQRKTAQGKEDEENIIRLVKATSIGLEERFGQPYRKAIDATFLHNGTYLVCDTALWNVNAKYINAWGNVKLTQDKVVLTSEKMDYDIDRNQAMFRGALVELKDDKNNILRTVSLDYNTKDSLGIFQSGGSMQTSDGQVIESDRGYYHTSQRLVNFLGAVNMYSDTVFIRTKALDYSTATKTAYFIRPIDFWREGDMLSSNTGWYEKESETFYFSGDVHGTSGEREAWCDSMYYYRTPNDVLMLGDAQMQDTVKKVVAFSNYMLYESELKQITLFDNAAVAIETQRDNKTDTLYCGADTLVYNAVKYADVPDSLKEEAAQRYSEIMVDAVGEYRKKAAEEAAAAAKKAVEEKAQKENAGRPRMKGAASSEKPAAPAPADTLAAPTASAAPADTLAAPADSLTAPSDTLAAPAPEKPAAPADTLAAPADSVVVNPLDSTNVGFLVGTGNVRLFREDMQMRADSVMYTDLDSIARFFIDPVIWNEGNRQYSSDSIFVLIRNKAADRASLMSNAMIITQEDSLSYDQIKSTEVMAFFNDKSELSRFDALGTANAVFYLEENGALATANVVESKMLSGTFKDGQLNRVYYYDKPKNDAYPSVQLPKDLRRLKGFNWQPERRPSSPRDITKLALKASQRQEYAKHKKPQFPHTEKYFPGCMAQIREGLRLARIRRDSIASASAADTLEMADDFARLEFEAIAPADTLASTDSLASADTLAITDSLAPKTGPVPADKTSQAASAKLERQKAAEARREEARQKKEAKWKALDEKDALKAAKKEQKALQRRRKKTLRQLKAQIRRDRSDERKLQTYIRRYERQKANKEKIKANGKDSE